MKATSVASSGIVHELLTRDNYEGWRVVMQNYLQGQGLWDVVQTANSEVELEALEKTEIDDAKAKKFWNILSAQNSTELKAAPDIEQGLSGHVQRLFEVEREASWKMMKNAKALHIIQLSCGREILDEISRFKTAKEVWNFLSEKYNKDLEVSLDSTDPQAISNYWRGQLEELRLFEEKEANLDDIYETTASRWTNLHAVTLSGDVSAVKWLVKKGEDRLVGMKDEKGYTALALAARYTGNTDIAKCMIESKKGNSREWLLEMENNDGEIPVLLASVNGYKEMTTYLYFKTPQKVFEGRDSRNRLFLLARCIAAEIFGVALSLLTRYPDLSREALLNLSDFSTENLLRKRVEGNFSILDALAHMPSAFPSGSRFGLLQQLFYDILSVKWEFSNSYGKENYPDYIGFVRAVTRSGGIIKMLIRWLPGFCRPVLKLLRTVMRLGWFCIQRALKLLGPLLGRIAYLLIQIFKWLNIFGIREIYDKKYGHYEVLGIVNCFRKSITDFNDSQLRKASAYDAILHAAQHGIIEFVYGLSKGNGNLLSAIDSCRRDIFAGAILNRKQNIFQLMHYLNGIRKETFRYRTDAFGNNLLHLAAHLGPSSDLDSRSGAALQMQREVQWFKAVEEFVHPLCKEAKNGDGKKPRELFTENHKELMKAGEKWAKDIATSFTIVGTLITTIMFAAAFTVPGGNNQETGLPIFLHDKIFTTFLVADAVSLFTSATSVIIFIGILTSRYAEQDFLKSLPWKLLFGLLPLILSVCSMIVAFCAALAIILKGYRTYSWFVVGPALSLASIPIIVLVASQLSLMYDIFYSTWKNPIRSISGGKPGWEHHIKKKFKPKSVSTPKMT